MESAYGGKMLPGAAALSSSLQVCGFAALFHQQSETKLFQPLVALSVYITREHTHIVIDCILSCFRLVLGLKTAQVCLLGLTYPAISQSCTHWYSCSCYSLQSAAEEV